MSRPGTSTSGGGSRPATAGTRPRTSASSRAGSAFATADPEVGRPVTSTSRTSIADYNVDDGPASPGRTDDRENLFYEEEPPPKGCWWHFTHFLCGMWSTRQMVNRGDDRELFQRSTVRELAIYCCFLVVLIAITFGTTSSVMFYYTQVMGGLFIKAKDVDNVESFWEFMETDLLDGLYWEYAHGGEEKRFSCPGGEDRVGPCPVVPSDRNILYENRMLGLPRIRQLRVRNDSCSIHPHFQNAIHVCYNDYNSGMEDEKDFGNGFRRRTGEDAWRYRSAGELGGSSSSGYSAGGYHQDMSSMKNESLAVIQELREGLWIDKGTRMITIDFTVYNANINLFCIVKLLFEFPPTGGVTPFTTFYTVKLLRHVDSLDYFIFACELIFVCFLLFYIVEEALEIMKHKCGYFSKLSNDLDIVVLVLSIITMIYNYYMTFNVEEKLSVLLSQPDKHSDFSTLASAGGMANAFVALNVFFAMVKMFKYISFNKTMTQLTSTLSKCGKDVASFFVMFAIVFLAFAQLGNLLFGTMVKDFDSFYESIFTLLRTILGDFDFHAIQKADRLLGPVFFMSYVLFVFFILMNIFLAIINDTYSLVKTEIAVQKNDVELSEFAMRGYNNLVGNMGQRDREIDLENALQESKADNGDINYEELRYNLKKLDFADMEIEMFFARYDTTGDGVLNEDDEIDDITDLFDRPDTAAARAASAFNRPETGRAEVVGEEFGLITRRVNRMENGIGSIAAKIDAVLGKLNTMDSGKAMRRAAVNKMMNSVMADDNVDEETKRKRMEELVMNELEQYQNGSRPGTGK